MGCHAACERDTHNHSHADDDGIDLDQEGVLWTDQLVEGMQGECLLATPSRCETIRLLAIAIALIAVLTPGDGRALVLTPFRYEDQAQRHCPADTVVWLDFKKRKYYLSSQKLYGSGFHGSFVCLQEARRNLYRRSPLGLR